MQLSKDENELKALKKAESVDTSKVSQLETTIEIEKTINNGRGNEKVAKELDTQDKKINELQGTFIKLSTELKALSDKQTEITK